MFSEPFHRVRHIMLQRTLAVCVFSLFILGTVSESQAGGFLQRLRGNACSGRLLKWNRHCAVPESTCQTTPQPCAPSVRPCCTSSVESHTLGQQSSCTSCFSQYLANCELCRKVYKGDPHAQARCRAIARKAYCKCKHAPSLQECAAPGLCYCIKMPEDPAYPDGRTCMDCYRRALQDEQTRPCAEDCYFQCLLDSIQP